LLRSKKFPKSQKVYEKLKKNSWARKNVEKNSGHDSEFVKNLESQKKKTDLEKTLKNFEKNFWACKILKINFRNFLNFVRIF